MKVVGLIVEYNPFHNGHLLHLKEAIKATKADYVICVMSGQFVQRGEPAIIDKWYRTKMALQNGADLVIELPALYATASAEYFAMASVSLLHQLGVVDCFCFGSEHGKLDKLMQLASLLYNEPGPYKALLATYLEQGYNFPKARHLAVKDYMTADIADLLSTSNNILGIEYLKALKRLNSHMKPVTILRKGASYHDNSLSINTASASAIRTGIKKDAERSVINMQIPEATVKVFDQISEAKLGPLFMDDAFTLIKYDLIKKTDVDLNAILDITEGLENRFASVIKKSTSYDDFIHKVGTKRYTTTRLQRALTHMLLDIKREDFARFIRTGYHHYVRVLGFNQNATPLLKEINETCELPVIVNVSKSYQQMTSLQKDLFAYDLRATDLYNALLHDKYGVSCRNDFEKQIIRVV